MAEYSWYLIEWVDIRGGQPVYDIIRGSDVVKGFPREGKVIVARDKKEVRLRKAEVLRVTASKRHAKDLKEVMENQNLQMRTLLSMCMRPSRQRKSKNMLYRMCNNFPEDASLSKRDLKRMSNVSGRPDTSSSSDDDIPLGNRSRFNSSGSNLLDISDISDENPEQFDFQHNATDASTSPVPVLASSPLPGTSRQNTGTQTENINVNLVDRAIKHLYRSYMDVIEDIRERQEIGRQETVDNCNTSEESQGEESQENVSDEELLEFAQPEIREERIHIDPVVPDVTESDTSPPAPVQQDPETVRVRRVSAQTTNHVDMTPIGDLPIMIPTRVLRDIDWSSYTIATRQLLQAVFPRKVLATHSLSGKQSPAFAHRPPKKQLDPYMVNDVVTYVRERCLERLRVTNPNADITRTMIRSIITIKCADEAKLFRNRQRHRNEARQNENGSDERSASSGSSEDWY